MKGLCNLGATCYINTTIQCLFSVSKFRNFIIEYQHDSEFLVALKQLFHQLSDGKSNPQFIIPRELLKVLVATMGKIINLHEQNDINEFYSIFIDKLNSSISQKVTSKKELPQPNNSNAYDKLKARVDKAWFNSHCNEMSPLVDLIYGQTISQIVCGQCQKVHHNYEAFTCIHLGIPKTTSDYVDLKDCMIDHFKDHMINCDKDNKSDKWKCDKCAQSDVPSMQSSTFWKLPDVCVISLKRFDGQCRKNQTSVRVPEEIDMTTWVLSQEKSTKYQLVAVGIHLGSFYGGHYYAVAKKEDKWYRLDDEVVVEMDPRESSLIARNGYMYFYELI